jgi:hypothetical protein
VPTSHHHAHAAEADAVADAVCLRRVLNAFLTMVAAWALYGVVMHRAMLADPQPWWCVAPISVTALTTFFAAWAVFFGDRLVWLRAFRRAARASRSK